MTTFDFAKLFTAGFEKSFPGTDLFPIGTGTFLELQRKNMEAFSEAQKLAMIGLQSAAQLQAEIFSQAIQDNSALARELMSESTPEAKIAKHTEIVKKVYEKSVKNIRELSSTIEKSSQQATDVINKRISASLSEIKSAVQKEAAASPLSTVAKKAA
jgi:phasin family protein